MLMKNYMLFMLGVCYACGALACDTSDTGKPFYLNNPYFHGKYSMSVEEVHSFFNKLKFAIKNDNEDWISSNTVYPIKIYEKGEAVTIKNGDEFKNNYDLIINGLIKKAVRCQKFDDLFINWRGVMVGGGAIWFRLVSIENVATMVADPSQEGAVSEGNSKKKPDLNDRSKWQYKIISISSGSTVKNFVESCRCEQPE